MSDNQKWFRSVHLDDSIVKALELLGIHQPTEVQEQVIPKALLHLDLIVQSQTGSGKTLAYALPILEKIHWESNRPQALILVPTRELAVQVTEELTNVGLMKRIHSVALFGKDSYLKQKNLLKQKTHVVIGTPGRVLDHLQKGTLIVEEIKHFIIDEADEMLNMGFIDNVKEIMAYLPKEKQTLFFSATYPEEVKELCLNFMRGPESISIKPHEKVVKQIEHAKIEIPQKEKRQLLQRVLIKENPDSCIIFCQTQKEVDQLYRVLNQSMQALEKLHGGLAQRDRFRSIEKFRDGSCRYLIATGLAGRGIDVKDVSLIIHFDVPTEVENYVHRSGRTGRAEQSGKVITLVSPDEQASLEAIEAFLGYNIPVLPIPSEEETQRTKHLFDKKMRKTEQKESKAIHLQTEVTKLFFNGGKKKKLRAIDFVGAITNIDGVDASDIGVISIYEHQTYVDILNGKGKLVLSEMKMLTVKGKQLKVHIAKKS
ncbi:DEAD/DEAH box helicase [Alkalihalobacillus pseudalcaliphilus]|uniref:DEAD/DEAH box helicase n=1 Tax=Alkalihalobacillus pseudalcaliphilus TaxID=79884 RepID=UPI00064DFFB9|nr:DEAD/DEAH box helicase [Alkalihalobacillus pseudalcaliphilus]KMK75085.1 RNA helicase [Alkalihalobacillus pseudalcaliphilus]